MIDKVKRIGVDAAGYFLILLGIATGWLPGPGGIPLILGGLALLSLNNDWAKRLRDWLVRNGADFITRLLPRIFPNNKAVQLGYDIVAGGLLVIVAVLVSQREALWKIGLATGLFILVLLIIGTNRDRATRIRRHYRHKKA